MPRDSNGNYTLPAGVNPVVVGTTIAASWANPTLTDVAQGVTDSLDRSGRGGMLAAFRVTDGTAAVPGLAFTNETTSGLFRQGSGAIGVALSGTEKARFVTGGLDLLGGVITALTTTQSPGTNNTTIASTAFVQAAIAALPASFPAGAIVMWSGTIATIPAGWKLCDGTLGTPDLRDKFVIGARQDDVGVAKTNVTGALTQTGGSKDELVISHSHTYSANTGTESATHTHSVNDPGHSHAGSYLNTSASAFQLNAGIGMTASGIAAATTGITLNTQSANHTHAVSGTTSTDGSSGTNANLPPYYALAFIQKS